MIEQGMVARMSKYVHLALGGLCVALGLIGAVLPVMPTTVFLILAAFFFTKGSPRLRMWLLDHAHFGPLIRDWEATGAIPRRIKILSLSMMAASFGICVILGLPAYVLIAQAVLMSAGAAYILTRPDS
ncbi:YbaN family protein [Celeribacter baekdonensis]